ncbi:MAG TPA: sugar transferase [Gemmatimonadaceae bacterium]|nr:sugar transferase [Gemmatimonadaceae bacterium]
MSTRVSPAAAPTRLVHVTTIPMSLTFLVGQVDFMRARGFSVSAISSPGPDRERFAAQLGIDVHTVEMPRRITPLRDLAALAALVRTLRRIRPHVVHAHTPKGGLLGTTAAAIAGVPVRIYHMRGLPLTAATGWRRTLLRATERVSCMMAHRVICNSASLRQVALAERVCAAEKMVVLGAGSGNGVDAEGRFHPDRLPPDTRTQVRARLGIPVDALVVGFVGRVVRDKGVVELLDAWHRLRDDFPDAHLLVVGPVEPQDPVPAETLDALRNDPRVHLAGMDWDTPPLYAAMDLVTLPTYREGFPNVPLEAAAMRLPVVATRVPGCVDAVVDGVTGTLVPARDATALAHALAAYLGDAELRRAHGHAGRERVLRDFRPERLWDALYNEYARLLARPARRRVYAAVKRAMDLAAALAALVLLSPVMLLAALAVRIALGKPVLFRQTRPGLHGRPFVLYKFRTMRNATAPDGTPLPDAERLTPLGRLLRSTSVDELPEMWNVLKGDLSLVGPRPLLMEYLPLYTPEQARRHDVRPGVTGWAQVNGRNALTWEEKLALDVWYVDHRGTALDLRILLRTLKQVIVRHGISHQGHATMERFRGSL